MDIIPFSKETNSYIKSINFNSNKSTVQHNVFCNKCNLIIKDSKNNSIYCNSSRHYIHLKCASLNKTKLKGINPKLWNCDDCNPFPFVNLDNAEFNLGNNFNSLSMPSSKVIQYKVDNSFDFFKKLPKLDISNPLPEEKSMASDKDDTNMHNIIDFEYNDLNKFNKTFDTTIKENSISFFHTNIRSYSKNMLSLEVLLNDLNVDFDVIGLTETWLPEKKQCSFSPILMPTYQNFEYLCGQTQNSGCGFYVKQGIYFDRRHDLSSSTIGANFEFEILFIEIHRNNSRNMLIGVIYRHPTKEIQPFLNKLENILNICKSEKKDLVIMGDFNLDLLKSDKKEDIGSFLDLMFCNFLQPHIIQR